MSTLTSIFNNFWSIFLRVVHWYYLDSRFLPLTWKNKNECVRISGDEVPGICVLPDFPGVDRIPVDVTGL